MRREALGWFGYWRVEPEVKGRIPCLAGRDVVNVVEAPAVSRGHHDRPREVSSAEETVAEFNLGYAHRHRGDVGDEDFADDLHGGRVSLLSHGPPASASGFSSDLQGFPRCGECLL